MCGEAITLSVFQDFRFSILFQDPTLLRTFKKIAKMTIISTYRNHTYKASATIHRRDVSPKKTFIQKPAYTHKLVKTVPTKIQTVDPSQVLQSLVAMIMNSVASTYNDYTSDDVSDDYEHYETTLSEEDYEEAMAHQDYLEWLYD